MNLRVARHTTDLQKIEQFYTEIIGLEKLGSFQNHDNYDGIFLGLPHQDWHLEFTISTEKPQHQFDNDDILVFYVYTEIELEAIRKNLQKHHISPQTPKNPYWAKNGLLIADPDGHNIIFSIKQRYFCSNDDLTLLVREKSIQDWHNLLVFIRNLPYRRNKNRHDFSLVIKENQGTCSSKHALAKKMADLNGIEQVKLILGIYKMNHCNTPQIGNTLTKNGLIYMPEAHCYLKLNNRRIDLTNANADIAFLQTDILEEIEITPEQVDTFKVEYHKNYLQKWIATHQIPYNLPEIWAIREQCIKLLSTTNYG